MDHPQARASEFHDLDEVTLQPTLVVTNTDAHGLLPDGGFGYAYNLLLTEPEGAQETLGTCALAASGRGNLTAQKPH